LALSTNSIDRIAGLQGLGMHFCDFLHFVGYWTNEHNFVSQANSRFCLWDETSSKNSVTV
jgi:hypothetical protein